jgi:TetR/AcrR family transcriptional regulator, transcriptional repressor for nem operon
MRYPAAHKAETRERIVQAAARRFRARGTEGAVIGDLMRDLHLTHGGFYRHFSNKEELFVDAFVHSLEERGRRIVSIVEQAPPRARLKALIDTYLDVGHCERVADGCPVAALASELARRPRAARAPLQRALKAHMRLMAQYLPGATVAEREAKARLLFSGMLGTLTMARVAADETHRRALLESARQFFLDAVRR